MLPQFIVNPRILGNELTAHREHSQPWQSFKGCFTLHAGDMSASHIWHLENARIKHFLLT